MKNPPHILISYSSKDRSLVEKIHLALKAAGFKVWREQTGLEKLAHEIICHVPFGIKNRKSGQDLLRFKFYKLALAVKFIMALARLYEQITFSSEGPQMTLPFAKRRPAVANG